MKKYLFSLLVLLLTSNCSKSILEYEQVDKLNVQEDKKDGRIYLNISGLCMYSSLVIKDKEVISNRDTLQILIEKSLTKKNADSGSFSYNVEIPSHTNFVVFGKNKVLIWDRKKNK